MFIAIVSPMGRKLQVSALAPNPTDRISLCALTVLNSEQCIIQCKLLARLVQAVSSRPAGMSCTMPRLMRAICSMSSFTSGNASFCLHDAHGSFLPFIRH